MKLIGKITVGSGKMYKKCYISVTNMLHLCIKSATFLKKTVKKMKKSELFELVMANVRQNDLMLSYCRDKKEYFQAKLAKINKNDVSGVQELKKELKIFQNEIELRLKLSQFIKLIKE